VTSGIAEDLFRRAGVLTAGRDARCSASLTTGAVGATEALTGPAVRGDATTIERNLAALRAARPDAVAAYVVLCRAALELAAASGRLPQDRRAAVEAVLAPWS
jgi:predicted short-subunit dehydrogenase-like oxidoreductase (DUF2520 family)